MKLITGTWQDLNGSPVAGGRVFFKLSQDAVAAGTTQVSTALISFTLDANGSIPANTLVWFNDELSPSGTTYTISVLSAGGGKVWGAESVAITGSSPFNLNTAIPTIQNVFIAFPSLQKQIFTSSGTFTIPAIVTQVKATVVGGGGGGAGAANTSNGNGGGAGGTAVKWLTGLTPNNTIAVTVGTGGAGGVAGANNGTAGNPSSIASGTQSISTVTASGGNGGTTTGGAGAAGGTTSGGDLNITGGAGVSQTNPGGNVGTSGGSGFLGSGAGAGGNNSGGGVGSANSGAGGGGASGGAGAAAGGNGGSGLVMFEWIS